MEQQQLLSNRESLISDITILPLQLQLHQFTYFTIHEYYN